MSDWRIVGPAPSAQQSDWRIVGPAPQQSIEEPWYQSPFISGVTGFDKGVKDITHGILQPLLESGYLGQNVKRGSQEAAEERQREYNESSERNPLSTLAGNVLGSTAISLPAMYASGGILGASRIPGFLKYLSPILSGGIGGAATGAAQYVNPGESRGRNALVGGLMGKILGAGGMALKGAGQLGSAFYKTRPPKKFLSKVVGDRTKNESLYSKGYESVGKEARKSGADSIDLTNLNTEQLSRDLSKKQLENLNKLIRKGDLKSARRADDYLSSILRRNENQKSQSRIILPDSMKGISSNNEAITSAKKQIEKELNKKIPKLDLQNIISNTTSKDNASLKRYLSEPTVENAHYAQSSLGKLTRRLGKRDLSEIGPGLSDAERKIYGDAVKQRQLLQSSIDKRLQDVNRPDLVDKYNKLTQGYERDVLTYKRNKALNEYLAGELTPEDAIKKLASGKKFKAKKGLEQYPELYKLPALGKIGAGIGSGILGYKLRDLLTAN